MRNKNESPSKARSAIGVGLYGLLLIVSLAVGSAAGWIRQSPVLSHIIGSVFNPKPPSETFGSNTLTLLVLGCDEDIADFTHKVLKKQARSDMMLIAKLDFKNNLITGVSIPRDTELDMPGYPHGAKINAYHEWAKKGHEAELTQKAVQMLLPGVKIDRVVTLDFDAFQQIVDLVGGVPVLVDKKYDYDDTAGNLHIHLKPGMQTLNGYNAMCFVRERHADSDFARQARQKQFLLAFKKQALRDWLQVPAIVNKGVQVMGDAMTTDELASIALFARSIPPQNIQWGQIPVVDGRGTNFNVNRKQLPAVLAQYRLLDTDQTPAANSTGENH